MKRMMPIQGQWLVFDDNDLRAMEPDDADGLLTLYNEYLKNKISFFLGHGGALDFINDRDHDLCVLTAPNRGGKSFAGAQWVAMRILPCDPSWPCFQQGLDYHPWEGAKPAVVCSYTIKDHIRAVLNPLILEVFPDDELKEYSPRYKGKGKKKVNFAGDMKLPLACGSEINYRAYIQDQTSFESAAFKVVWTDEQIPQDRLDGLIERGRTGMDKTQYASTMTPHYMEGFPETGGASPIMQAIKGHKDIGLSIGHYKISIEDIPTCIYPQEEKDKAYRRWVLEPKKSGNQKEIREGRARYYGEPQSSQGMVIDEFDRDTHVIDPIKIKPDWTLYRGMDHGGKNPTACIWGAVDPYGFVYIYREYYQSGKTIPENAEEIVKASGNTRIKLDTVEDPGGLIRPIYDEDFTSEDYAASVLDSRSFGTKADGVNTIGNMYNEWGLYCTKASGKRDSFTVPMVNSWFRVDPDLKNPITGEMGSPRIFIFDNCVNLICELEELIHKGNSFNQNENEDVRKKKDHAYDGLKYLLGCNPIYLGNNYMKPINDPLNKVDRGGQVSSYTGY